MKSARYFPMKNAVILNYLILIIYYKIKTVCILLHLIIYYIYVLTITYSIV